MIFSYSRWHSAGEVISPEEIKMILTIKRWEWMPDDPQNDKCSFITPPLISACFLLVVAAERLRELFHLKLAHPPSAL